MYNFSSVTRQHNFQWHHTFLTHAVKRKQKSNPVIKKNEDQRKCFFMHDNAIYKL